MPVFEFMDAHKISHMNYNIDLWEIQRNHIKYKNKHMSSHIWQSGISCHDLH